MILKTNMVNCDFSVCKVILIISMYNIWCNIIHIRQSHHNKSSDFFFQKRKTLYIYFLLKKTTNVSNHIGNLIRIKSTCSYLMNSFLRVKPNRPLQWGKNMHFTESLFTHISLNHHLDILWLALAHVVDFDTDQ